MARVDLAPPQILHTYKVSGNLIENATRRQITQTYAPQALKGRDLIGSCRQTSRSEVRPTARMRVYSIRSKCWSMARVDLAQAASICPVVSELQAALRLFWARLLWCDGGYVKRWPRPKPVGMTQPNSKYRSQK